MSARTRVFCTRDIVGFRAFGWQFDYRPTLWLPLFWKVGPGNDDQPTIVRVGRGHLTWGRVTSL